MEIEVIDFNIVKAVESVTLPFKHKLGKHVNVSVEFDKQMPQFVRGDLHKLIQVLNNLVGNASKFTSKGEIKLQAFIKEHSDEIIKIEFKLSDTGIGIPSENLNGIFDSFSQGSIDTVRKFGGTGLGLAITKRLIELQGGNIFVESELGVGTVFTFEIPFTPSKVTETEVVVNEVKRMQEKDSLKGKKILIVEDNKVNQKVVVSILRNLMVESMIANNGKEAVEILQTVNDFDLIIMDLQMPEMDGFQTTVYIRQKLKIKTPIIAMTASALRNEKGKCFEMGMNGYLTKPFKPESLIENLNTLINEGENDKQEKQNEMSNIGLYDLEQLKQIGDESTQVEVLTVILESTPVLLGDLKRALLFNDLDSIYKNAHELKSNLGILQADSMLQKCSSIEIAVKENNMKDVPEWAKKLDDEFKLIKPMLEDEITELNKTIAKME